MEITIPSNYFKKNTVITPIYNSLSVCLFYHITEFELEVPFHYVQKQHILDSIFSSLNIY